MMANRAGRFHAYPANIGVDETGPNNLATVIVAYSISEELANGEWVDVSSEGMEITGYHYIEQKDGSLNESTIKALKSSFGWDGQDLFFFSDNPEALRDKPVQIVLDFEEYNSQQRLKVKWLNPYGSAGTGGVTQADDSTRKSMSNRLGARLSAISGAPANPAKPGGKPIIPGVKAAPKPAAAAPAGKPPTGKAPAARPAPVAPPAAPAAPAATATINEAWQFITSKCNPTWGQEDLEKEWFRVLDLLLPGVAIDNITPEQWAVVMSEAPGKILPF